MAKHRPDARQFAADLRRLAAVLDALASVDEAGDGATNQEQSSLRAPGVGTRASPQPVAAERAAFPAANGKPAKTKLGRNATRDAIIREIKADPTANNRQISQRVGCSHSHVGVIRKSLSEESGPAEDARPPPADAPPQLNRRRAYSVSSPIYNLPACLVDDIADFDLRRPSHLALAHKIADSLTSSMCLELEELEAEGGNKAEWLAKVHSLIDSAAERTPVIADEIRQREQQFAEQKAILHAKWSDNHERKANNYPIEPVVSVPVSTAGLMLDVPDSFD